MNEKNLKIIAELRKNARESLTKISKKTRIPVSTIFDRLKENEKELIIKHTSLIDFSKLGYITRANIILKFNRENRKEAGNYLKKHLNVNSLLKITNGFDYMAEVIFKNLFEMENFKEELEAKFQLIEFQSHYIIEDIKREEFMSDSNMLGLI